jgi:hypothetical protein
MRLEVVGGVVLCLGSMGCAGRGLLAGNAVACRPARAYSRAEVETIMRLRDDGAGLADVAHVVGGSRCDVKLAEAAEKSRRRGHFDHEGPVVATTRTR